MQFSQPLTDKLQEAKDQQKKQSKQQTDDQQHVTSQHLQPIRKKKSKKNSTEKDPESIIVEEQVNKQYEQQTTNVDYIELYNNYEHLNSSLQAIKTSYQKQLLINQQQKEYIQQLMNQIQNNITEKVSLQQKINELQVNLKCYQSQVQYKPSTKNKTILEALESNADNFLAKFQDDIRKQHSANQISEDKDIQIQLLQQQLQSLIAEINQKNQEMQNMRKQILNLHEITSQVDIRSVQVMNESLQQQNSQLQQTMIRQQQQIIELNSVINNLQQTIEQLKSQQTPGISSKQISEIVQKQIDGVQHTYNQMLLKVQNDYKNANDDNSQLISDIQRYKQQLQHEINQNTLISKKYDDLLMKYENHVQNATTQDAQNKKIITGLEISLQSKIQQILQYQQHIFRLKQQLRAQEDDDIFLKIENAKELLEKQQGPPNQQLINQQRELYYRDMESRQQMYQQVSDQVSQLKAQLDDDNNNIYHQKVKKDEQKSIYGDSSSSFSEPIKLHLNDEKQDIYETLQPKKSDIDNLQNQEYQNDSDQQQTTPQNDDNKLKLSQDQIQQIDQEQPNQVRDDQNQITSNQASQDITSPETNSVINTYILNQQQNNDEFQPASSQSQHSTEQVKSVFHQNDSPVQMAQPTLPDLLETTKVDVIKDQDEIFTYTFNIKIQQDYKIFKLVKGRNIKVLCEFTNNQKEIEYIYTYDPADTSVTRFDVIINDMQQEIIIDKLPFNESIQFDGNQVQISVE